MQNLTTTGEAAVDAFGGLHARASFSSTGVLPPSPPGGARRVVQIVARAALYDVLTISGAPTGSSISFLGVLTGTATATATPPAQAGAFPYYGIEWFDQAQGRYLESSFAIPGNAGFPASRANPLVFAVTNGTYYFSTFLEANAGILDATAAAAAAGQPLVGAGDADYSQTGRIAAVRVRNAQGDDITDQLTLTFASGLAYGASTVPEPGTWALLGTGLLGVGGMAARRRRTKV